MDAPQLAQTHLPIVPSRLTHQLSMDVQQCLVVFRMRRLKWFNLWVGVPYLN
jgi:hypothetical protein